MKHLVYTACLVAIMLMVALPNSHTNTSDYVPDQSAPKAIIHADYKGISFNFDRSLASAVKSETVPICDEGKPADIWPEHAAFTLVGYPHQRGVPENFPQLRVFRLNEFRKAFEVAYLTDSRGFEVKPPSWTTIYFDTEVRRLKLLLRSKPPVGSLKKSFTRSNTEMCSGTAPIPFLPLWEACQAFTAHLSYVRFKNGEGDLFLTQWDTETSAVTNAGLEYAFQGLTDDGLYSVYAEFAVKSPTLPFGDEPEVVQWNMKNYLLLHRSKKYQDYVHPFVNSLEQTQPDKFQPSLRLLQELVESLEVKPD